MTEDNPTTDEVFDSIVNNLPDNVEAHVSDVANGVQITVPNGSEGLLYRELRKSGVDFNSRRLGDSIVAHIEAEETGGLADLFRR